MEADDPGRKTDRDEEPVTAILKITIDHSRCEE